jgi:hypothetical protein
MPVLRFPHISTRCASGGRLTTRVGLSDPSTHQRHPLSPRPRGLCLSLSSALGAKLAVTPRARWRVAQVFDSCQAIAPGRRSGASSPWLKPGVRSAAILMNVASRYAISHPVARIMCPMIWTAGFQPALGHERWLCDRAGCDKLPAGDALACRLRHLAPRLGTLQCERGESYGTSGEEHRHQRARGESVRLRG